jgi:hypothetical protein
MNIRGAGVPCVISGLLPGPTGPTGAGGAIGYYGSFYDKTDQPLVSTTASQVVSLGMTSINNGVSIAGGNRVLFDYAGVYSVTFSILWTNTGNDVEQVNVWLKLNGNDIADSGTRFDVLQKKNASTLGHSVGTVNFVLDINPADYIQVYWSGTSTNLKIEHFGTGSSPTHPEVPGIIITAVQTMYSVSGGGGGSSFIWEGAWSSGTTYAVNDVVEYNGSSYIAIQAGTNQQPDTATTYWELMAAKGATGSTGATGATGPQGPQGDPGAGVATGGTTGQYLRKSSATNYDTAWTTFALVNADIDVSANIDWSKINKTGSSLADLATRTTANLTDFPSQTGNSGKYLTTNGLGTLSWGSVSGASQNLESLRRFVAIGDLASIVGTESGGRIIDYVFLPESFTISNIDIVCPNAASSGTITIDILSATTSGGSFSSLYSSNPKPTLTCAGGASFVTSTSLPNTTSLSANTVLAVKLVSAPLGSRDLYVSIR